MFEKFTSANARDFQQRYQGTFGFYRDKDKPPILVRINFVEGVVAFNDKRGIEYTLNPDRPGDIGFEFLPPKSGYFNTSQGAYYVQRRATRQFQRGVSDRNVEVYLVRASDAKQAGFSVRPVNFNTLEQVYESTITPKEAYSKLLKGEVESIALSAQIALSRSHLYVLAHQVGHVVKLGSDEVMLGLDDKDLFRTEITDAFRAINVKVDIK